uniref:Branched-chain-amino-acid aminotransferase n=1 Tax=Steinernema glaseri TaxID=37863 RepID=A0A1I7Y794_9BILA
MKNLLTTGRHLVFSVRLASSSSLGQTASPAAAPAQDTFYHRDLKITAATPGQMRPKPPVDTLKFGHNFSDHMMEVDWNVNSGWTRPAISPLHNLSLHPGAKVLHYAVELFEGMKAYRGVDNKIRLFRPEMNMERMRRTAARSALPDFDTEECIKIISDLVKLDQEWVPYSTTSSLYIRPTFIGTEATLGVGHPNDAKFFVLTGPAGAYYQTGFNPISLLADSDFVRAFPGGVGSYKMGCNYSPTILVGRMAAEKGCQQVLWLYGEEEQLTEVGTMNIFVYWINEQGEEELVTPPLDKGLILPGVTRQSLLDLARSWNQFKVTERYITMPEVIKSLKERRMREMFGAGTACVVSPVGRILHKNKATGDYSELLIPTMESKPNLMQKFYETIMDIQYGRVEQPGWTRIVS